jgi:steroid delta-isomerase-like uncharacterized protein
MELETKVDPEDVVKKWCAAWNRHDLDAVVAMLDPNFVQYSPVLPEPVKGRDAWRKNSEPSFKAFPDAEFRILNIMAKGDTVASEALQTGTFKAPLEFFGRTIPPTGRRAEIRMAVFHRVNSKGLIAEERVYEDMAEIYRQFGLKA